MNLDQDAITLLIRGAIVSVVALALVVVAWLIGLYR
jgi:hypothetical protein